MLRAGSRWVLWLLIFLSIAAAAVVLERLWFFAANGASASRCRHAGGPAQIRCRAATKALGEARSMQATVARACLDHLSDGSASVEEYIAATIEGA